MCWNSTKPSNANPKVATKPIKVYKICRKDIDSRFLWSYYFKTLYAVGATYKLPTKISVREYPYSVIGTLFEIDGGYHSYSRENTYIEQKYRYSFYVVSKTDYILDCYKVDIVNKQKEEDIVKVLCTIPEGATYYENDNGEIVSDQITINSYETILSCVG